jgi:hypothetical protein
MQILTEIILADINLSVQAPLITKHITLHRWSLIAVKLRGDDWIAGYGQQAAIDDRSGHQQCRLWTLLKKLKSFQDGCFDQRLLA